MDPREIDAIVQRLIANPHDSEAIAYAHHAGQADPRTYATLLERVGAGASDAALASHWFTEAAAVWQVSVGDMHRAARVLMLAIDKDPTQDAPAERLAALYREKGESRALAALLERRTRALAPLASSSRELQTSLAAMHEELGRLWAEPPLANPKKALDSYRRARELDPSSAYAVFAARELYKQAEQWSDALALYEPELALVEDPARKTALLCDEADVRQRVGDRAGAVAALGRAHALTADDATLSQQFAGAVLELVRAGEQPAEAERDAAVAALVSLAETYDGEYGLAYASGALDLAPGHDRAMQLAAHWAGSLGRDGELPTRWAAYLAANPAGLLADEARTHAGVQLAALEQAPTADATPVESAAAAEAPSASVAQASPDSDRTPVPVSERVDLDPLSERIDLDAVSEPIDLDAPSEAGGVATEVHVESDATELQVDAAQTAVQVEAADAAVHVDAAETEVHIAAEEPVAPLHAPSAEELDRVPQMLAEAESLAQHGKREQADAAYREVLAIDVGNAEALSAVEDQLRRLRKWVELREVLTRAARAPGALPETRKAQLREVAGLCESQLRDVDGAIAAWRQIAALDRGDDTAREHLRRLLERAGRWDDLAYALERDASSAADIEAKIAIEKRAAHLHEHKRQDSVAAGEAWARVAGLCPGDEAPLANAVRLLESAGRIDLVVEAVQAHAPLLDDRSVQGSFFERIATLQQGQGDFAGAADSFATAADLTGESRQWEAAEHAYRGAEAWGRAAEMIAARVDAAPDDRARAALFAAEAELLARVGDEAGALGRLEQAAAADPAHEAYAVALEQRYADAGRAADIAQLLTARADAVADRELRVSLRARAARLLADTVGDVEAARTAWSRVLDDGDDAEALTWLAADAELVGSNELAIAWLKRLAPLTADPAVRAAVLVREAALLELAGDGDGALDRYETILRELDPASDIALARIAALEDDRGNTAGVAATLERRLAVTVDDEAKAEVARTLAGLYEGSLGDAVAATRCLELVCALEPGDFDALQRLSALCEASEQWERLAELLASLIEIEGDEVELSALAQKRAEILANRLDRGDDALAALASVADAGDGDCRSAFVELGDRLGWKGLVATKLLEWHIATPESAERAAALLAAFERLVGVGRKEEALKVGLELVTARTPEASVAPQLEALAVEFGDREALLVAHDLLAASLTGVARAAECVRQAEVLVQAGAERAEAITQGESGLAGVTLADAEPLLARIAALAPSPEEALDVWERQATRVRGASDKALALARAAREAVQCGATDRARGLFEVAAGLVPADDGWASLEVAAAAADAALGGTSVRRVLAEAFAIGSGTARDGGRTRAALLRRAAAAAEHDLGDAAQAFAWLGDALVAHVEPATLDALDALGARSGDRARQEATLDRSLAEVFDGPHVRLLLASRATLRRDVTANPAGAALDLKRLYDLAPSDAGVLADLEALLGSLADHRTLVQVVEDQILRGKDPAVRADLARKVARLWDAQVSDPREAADAWRRVLRMRPGDEEAHAGLERSKAAMNPASVPPTARSAPPARPASSPPPAVTVRSTPAPPPVVPVVVAVAHEPVVEPVAAAAPSEAVEVEAAVAPSEAVEVDAAPAAATPAAERVATPQPKEVVAEVQAPAAGEDGDEEMQVSMDDLDVEGDVAEGDEAIEIDDV